ncbi:MAG: hypothetical protein PHS06_01425 [Candidatus Shapirobacteria bacterium]|nr:hypothetical protein [Candidatus Shapirobacteria bacterium]
MKLGKKFWLIISIIFSTLTYLILIFTYLILSLKYFLPTILSTITEQYLGNEIKKPEINFFQYILNNISIKEILSLALVFVFAVIAIFSLGKFKKISHVSIIKIILLEVIILFSSCLALALFIQCH